jgi:hypothetical protein
VPIPASRALAFAGPLLLATACSSASPDEQGGTPRFDAAPEPVSVNDDGGDACGNTSFDANAGTGWSDLYRDYFGPTSAASCAGSAGQCHGDSSSLGGGVWVCGTTVSSCYTGITSPAADLVTVGDTKDSPTTTTLYQALRKACGGGVMPQQPTTYFFSASDMARITDWIGAGAQNN